MANNTRDLLSVRLRAINLMVVKAAEYIEVIKLAIIGGDPGRYKALEHSLSMLREHPMIIMAALEQPAPSLHAWLDIYQHIAVIDGHACSIVSALRNESYAAHANYNMSTTYTTGTYRLRNAALSAYEEYLDASITDDDTILADIFANSIVGPVSNGVEPVSIIRSNKAEDTSDSRVSDMFAFVVEHKNVVNKFMIRLIAHVIPLVTGERRRVIELIVESQKDHILGSSRFDLHEYVGVQGLLVRYNMRPCGRSAPMHEVFKSLGVEYDNESHGSGGVAFDMERLCKALNVGILMINKATSSPVEFDMSGLIDVDYIVSNDMKTNPVSGLTKKVIDRFSTAVLLPKGAPADIVKRYSIVPEPSHWVVLESIDGATWRVMGLNGVKRIPANMMTGLLRGVTTRPQQYNNIQSEKILAHSHNPRASMILNDYEDMKTSPSSSEPMRITVLDRLCNDFEAKLKGGTLLTPAAVKAAAVDKNVCGEVIMDVLTAAAGVAGKTSAEYLITYISRFDGIIYDFTKKLERQWDRVVLTDRIFKENTLSELKRVLMDLFRTTTQAAIDELEQAGTWTGYDVSLKEFYIDREDVLV